MKRIFIIIWISFIYCFSDAQINIGGKPYSFQNQIKPVKIDVNDIPKIEVCELDFSKLIEEGNYNDSIGKPFRYGKLIEVAYSTKNSGEWIELENGDRIWRLEIHCPSAKSINLAYDKFWLPKGAFLYLYSKDKRSFIGGFNYRNNKGTCKEPSKYATGLLFSDNIILEYYEPKEVTSEGIIEISNIVYGYQDIRSLNSSLCTVDINCSPEGDSWQDEKTGVALVISNACVFSGSLIKNTKNNGIPYFLTAHHCIANTGNDAITNPDALDYLFWWNYELSECNGSSYSYDVTTGATVVANNSASDFALLKLHESPYDLNPQVQAYFNGWDWQNKSGGSTGIHHPQFQPKKISIDNHPRTSSGNYWKLRWDITSHGYSIIYNGSSGSPLFSNLNSRIVGQEYCSYSFNCTSQTVKYGKINVSWSNGAVPQRRLKDWLAPDDSNIQYINGSYCTGTESLTNTNLSSDSTIYGCDIYIENVNIINNSEIKLKAANHVIIDNDFEIELGSTLTLH